MKKKRGKFTNLIIQPEASPFIEYRLIPESAEVRVSGRQSLMENIRKDDITLFVNLSDTEKETVKIEAELPPNVTLVKIIPEEVIISIKK